MNLADRLQCPRCKGRFRTGPDRDAAASPTDALCCMNCEARVPLVDGIADFVGDHVVFTHDPCAYTGDTRYDDDASTELRRQIRAAAGDRWPATLGEVLELGCGSGQLTRILTGEPDIGVRGLIVADTVLGMIRRCRERVAKSDADTGGKILFVRLSGREDALRDAMADTVLGTAALARFGDVRALLGTVHRVLKPGGRAFFVVPNRRYHQALCMAMATALVRLQARDGAWPDGSHAALHLISGLRRQLLHQSDMAFLLSLKEKHLFDSDLTEDMAREVGFATAEVIPLLPDPLGGETTRRVCRDAAVPDTLVTELAPLVASAGAPFFSLLARRDTSALSLLWLTKGVGPCLRIFSGPEDAPDIGFTEPAAALGGAPPRWSLELAARDTQGGVVLSLHGWCLVNIDVRWLRLRIANAVRDAPVWLPRPDVHEVVNTHGLYHPMNALCCGIGAELLFDAVHPSDGQCALHMEIVLVNGLTIHGPAPHTLFMHQPLVIVG